MTQSQNLGSESGGNDSDNSFEEPSSFSDSRPLNRHSNLRQSLQRKPATDLKMLESTLVRGGPVRSSLHTLPSNTSTPARRIDKPLPPPPPPTKEKSEAMAPTTTDVANVVNLGGAGSRRTVYLVDENQLKADGINRSPTNSINLGNPSTAAAANSANNSQTNGNGAATTSASASDAGAPTTLLMYNRISNIISPLSEGHQGNSSDKFGSSSTGSQNNSNKGGSMEDKEKESAIWYEYGCV